jgi:hypothetical protein
MYSTYIFLFSTLLRNKEIKRGINITAGKDS